MAEGSPSDGLGGLADRVLEVGRDAGLVAMGICDTEPFLEARQELLDRRDAGLAGTMAFTYRNPERSTEPARLLRNAASLVVGAMPYRQPRLADDGDTARSGGVTGAGDVAASGQRGTLSLQARVARYATDDYYAVPVLTGEGDDARLHVITYKALSSRPPDIVRLDYRWADVK